MTSAPIEVNLADKGDAIKQDDATEEVIAPMENNTAVEDGAPVEDNTFQEAGALTGDDTEEEAAFRHILQVFAESGFILGAVKYPGAPGKWPQLDSDEDRHFSLRETSTGMTEWKVATRSEPPTPNMRFWYLLRPWFNDKQWHPLSDLDLVTRQKIYLVKRHVIDSATSGLMRLTWPGTVGFGIRIRRDWLTGRAIVELYMYNIKWSRVAVESSNACDTVLEALLYLMVKVEKLCDDSSAEGWDVLLPCTPQAF
ncbi:uncharacterized protein BKCO1_1100063 [Diplodia corticola]|uniref:Uncharacterized protein n=1 Tax=Diplodia corticola TaxID=236234 RepID=A0A1J9RV11_9PEZI|nr:uncharacterized protein BKCO1_1100063 [Diplodia corticola]OJD36427.1 hypothetical protein BKCO1_1100063 [Diplodia corticola]